MEPASASLEHHRPFTTEMHGCHGIIATDAHITSRSSGDFAARLSTLLAHWIWPGSNWLRYLSTTAATPAQRLVAARERIAFAATPRHRLLDDGDHERRHAVALMCQRSVE
jgi:hypothetical protein